MRLSLTMDVVLTIHYRTEHGCESVILLLYIKCVCGKPPPNIATLRNRRLYTFALTVVALPLTEDLCDQ